jgi:protein-tyrosine-phosphatase
MAAGFMRRAAGDRVRVLSGGSEPADRLNPAVVTAMSERGISLGAEMPRRWSTEDLQAADVVVTMGCGDSCPVLPGRRYVDWELPDPSGQALPEVRRIRDEIERRVNGLLTELQRSPD